MSASLVDNPRSVVRLRRESVHLGDEGMALVHFDSDSLFADRPELELRVPAENAPTFDGSHFDATSFIELSGQIVPSFRSRQTGERIVVAYALAPGDTLSILPRSPYPHALVPPEPAHLQRWVDRPTSSNPLSPVVRVNGVDVDAPVILFRGVTFDGARFGVDRFASDGDAPRFDVGHFEAATFDQPGAAGTLEVTTLAVVPGINTWEYVQLDTAGVAAALAAVPSAASLPPAPVVEAMESSPVALRLRWWTRPAARFLLRIPSTEAVRQSLELGAASYVRRMVDRVRPVGVTAVIDFLEPPFRDALEPSDGLQEVAIALVEPLSPLDIASTGQALPSEALEGLDVGAFGGIFDVTPFDFSRFGMPLVELSDVLEPEVRGGFIGIFDATPFEFGLLA